MNEQLEKFNTLRMVQTCHRQVSNLIKLGRYEEAKVINAKLTGILNVKSNQSKNQQEAVLKRSNPPITFTSQSTIKRIWDNNRKLYND